MLIGSVVSVVVVTLLVMRALDNPYRAGLGQLQPGAMERTLVVLEEEQRVTGETSELPCDDEGRESS